MTINADLAPAMRELFAAAREAETSMSVTTRAMLFQKPSPTLTRLRAAVAAAEPLMTAFAILRPTESAQAEPKPKPASPATLAQAVNADLVVRKLPCDISDELERAIAAQIVADALARGWSLSVRDSFDNEGKITVACSTDPAEIMGALASTEGDTIIAHDVNGRVGSVTLIYGNGCDVIHDSTDNPATAAWLAAAEIYAEAHA